MNTNSNSYTLLYAAVIVILSAMALAYVSESLKPMQKSNIATEKRVNILSSAHLAKDAANVPNRVNYVAAQFEKYITKSYVVDYRGNLVSGDAFETEMKKQYEVIKEKQTKKLRLPVFECTLDDGTLLYIVQCYGPGLWGPIWGYVSLHDDCNTIYGAVFDHKGETPGLGDEIGTAKYHAQFKGKKLFENGRFVSISVVKGGAKHGDIHAVDAVSGGTITSNALQELLFSSLEAYVPFFKNKSKQ